LVGASLVAGCSSGRRAEAKPPTPVKVQMVVTAMPRAEVRYSATIEPFQQVPLSFKASGYIEEVLRRSGTDGKPRVVQAGDRVAKGTVLARVRDADARERVSQGRARLTEAQSALKKATLDLERARALFAAESLIKPDFDAALAAFESAQARTAAAQADLELAQISLRDCVLVVPSSGVLLDRKVEVGSLVSPGLVGFIVADVSAVKARFGIPDHMIASVRLGEPIGVIVDAAAETPFAGLVSATAPAADPTSRVFDVEVTIRNPAGLLRPGMIGTVSLNRPASPTASAAAPSVPLTAVVKSATRAGQYAVVIVERAGATDVARLRPVELGPVVGNGIAVLKGLEAGERVIVTGASSLVDGEAVRIVS
jgi:RND family efflux transporter MFP subunit